MKHRRKRPVFESALAVILAISMILQSSAFTTAFASGEDVEQEAVDEAAPV